MPFRIGLTGSIGMGKSTTAQMFADEGIPVWDADAAVHRLYERGGAAVALIKALRPDAVRNGAVNRTALKEWIGSDPDALKQIERLVHPLVAADRQDFLREAKAPIVLLDIPLLFETNGEALVDAIVVVTAPADVQRARVLERGTLSPSQFETILAKQTPDSEKCVRADYVIETTSLEAARIAVHSCLEDIRRKLAHA